jgi:hypothetical protein
LAPTTTNAPGHCDTTVLDNDEAARRTLLLSELQAALAALGVQSIRARRHRLVLRYNDPPPLMPSGPTDPTLHVFTPAGTRVATTDGTAYRLDDGQELPAADPTAAAAAICSAQAPPRPADPGCDPTRDHLHHDLLTIAYPAFTITRQHYTWRKPRWEAVRKNPAATGLYAVITPDLDELSAALAVTITIKAEPGPRATPPEPEPPQ